MAFPVRFTIVSVFILLLRDGFDSWPFCFCFPSAGIADICCHVLFFILYFFYYFFEKCMLFVCSLLLWEFLNNILCVCVDVCGRHLYLFNHLTGPKILFWKEHKIPYMSDIWSATELLTPYSLESAPQPPITDYEWLTSQRVALRFKLYPVLISVYKESSCHQDWSGP